MLDLTKHFCSDLEIRQAKAIFVRLGFNVQGTIVSSQEPGMVNLLRNLISKKVSGQQLLNDVEKRFITASQSTYSTIKCNIMYDQHGSKRLIVDDKLLLLPYSKKDLPLLESGQELIAASQTPLNAAQPETVAHVTKQDVLPVPDPDMKQKVQVPKEEVITGPLWRDLPPQDKDDWVEPNVFDYMEYNNVWAITAASRRGKSHAHEGTHRDDSYAFGYQDGWGIIAVADGAGSCRRSRVGAKVGCQKAVEHLKSYLKGFKPELVDEAEIPEHSDLLKIKAFLIATMREVLNAVREEAQRKKIDFDDLSTTMLVAIHYAWKDDKSIIASMQIGDGTIAIWHGDGNVTILGTADSGNFASETKFITSKGIELELDHRTFFTFKSAVDAIAVMTDGVADDFFPPQKLMPRLFIEVKDALAGLNNPGEMLLNWLSYERRGSFDDRTIAILHRRPV